MSTKEAKKPRGSRKPAPDLPIPEPATTPEEVVRVCETHRIALWGEILRPLPGSKPVKYADLVAALEGAGLPKEAAREFLPKTAFLRAAKTLCEERVLDRVKEDKASVTYQLTRKALEDAGMVYTKQCFIVLNKQSGEIACEDEAVKAKAETELKRCIEDRTPSDVSGVASLLFRSQLDVWGIGPGVYLCPQSQVELAARVECYLVALGGRLNRFPIPKGTPQGDRSVQEVATSAVEQLIKDLEESVKSLGVSSRESTLDGRTEEFDLVKFKLEALSEMFGEKAGMLQDALNKAREVLKARFAAISLAKEAETGVIECDHCGHPHGFSCDIREIPRKMVCESCGGEFEIEL